MAYIGRTPSGGRFAKMDDISSGFNGSANTFSLSLGGDTPNIASDAQVIISVGGVIQEPETDFAIRTNQIVFTSAPPSGGGGPKVDFHWAQSYTRVDDVRNFSVHFNL